MRKQLQHVIVVAELALAHSVFGQSCARPNIVLILADDLGVECLSVYGGTSHRTPHLDRLAKEGMRLTRCFSNSYCSPSCGTLLTGRYPFINGLKVVLHSKDQEDIYLYPSQPSFVRQIKQHGYATQLVGKWHVSYEHKHNTIREFGFDHYQIWSIFDDKGRKSTRFWTPYLMRDGRIIVRWPGRIQAGSTCEDLVDLSDFLPIPCELTGANLPEAKIRGRSFAPQLLGKPGNPRELIHIQNAGDRQVRNSECMLDNKNQFRRGVQL